MQTPDMTSMAERLRARSAKKPLYNDEDDDFVEAVSERSSGSASKKGTKIARDDAKDDLCQTCGEDGRLFQCSTCTYAYHLKCLYPPLKIEPEGSWSCSNCVHPLNEIEKILHCEMKPISNDSEVAEISKGKLVKHYLVKWKRLSYLQCSWIPESDFLKAFKGNPRIRTKLNNFLKQMESMNGSEEDIVPIRPEWTTVDRIIASRKTNGKRQYLVKWKELPYDECYWEAESDISAFEDQIERFIKFQSRKRKSVSGKSKNSGRDAKDGKEKQSAFKQYEISPTFLSGGSLHPYQLEGLNFLRFSWGKQAHVILADEMGLGKTIQSIAYLASLFEESIAPHLVVAPLSTLRNWEREFATWAPHMNVILYVGSSQARAIIQQHEFHYSKIQDKKLKKKKKTKGFVKKEKGKKGPIKFDILLTSYEMINIDAMTLKQIKWECMIVDEGHRLKNKDSKLFNSLKIFSSNHRVLLTGTPLQNNLDELFMLMHFLDAGKFSSLSEFQEEFKDINQEEQVSRLHKMLAPHLLRRVKKDVMKDLPPKKELILRVELSSLQKDYYKAILTRNYKLLTRKGGPQISLNNIMMELRKLCCHAYMLGVEPEVKDKTEAFRKLLESSGKLLLLDKMMVRLKEQGHRVLIYSQFRHMLDLLEDYLCFKNWSYERIDGMISGTDRQIRIDRFNAKNSTRFCFLLSTRAGGLGINLATADTVIIYDSDWNPHADLQAMARAHRLGQTNKVMIFRLISRGTIEERMMQLTKKKMVLEHLVVGRLKNQGLNQEELDDIIRYGSKELFADEADETGKSRQIHYDDAAIDRLLDRDQVTNEEPATNDEEDDGFLEAFKVANFEYVDEAEVAEALEEAKRDLGKEKSNGSSSDRAGYWEELLKDKYDVQQIEEYTALGKGKRSRKQMTLQEDDDLAGLEDVGSDPEEDTEADWMDAETMPGNVVRRVHRKKLRVDAKDFVPLMEGEEKSLKVLGFNRVHRAAFVQTMLRFGTWDDDWSEYVYRIKNKSLDEIKAYALLFLEHLAEDITESPYFSDGVPKEELRIQDVLVRIAVLNLIRDKVTVSAETPGISIFPEDLMLRYPGLRSGKVWKKEQDVVLFQAILKHGYGRWQAIIEDKDLGLHKIICQELNLPCTYGNTDTNVPGQESLKLQSTDVKFENEKNDTKSTLNGSSSAAEAPGEAAQEIAKGSQRQDGSYVLSEAYPIQFRETQRRVIEFVKKRMVLLEKAITQEYAVDFFAYQPLESTAEPEHKVENSESNIKSTPSSSSFGEHLPSQGLYPILEPIAPTEVLSNSSQYQPDLYYLPRLYNQMCKTLVDIEDEAVQAHMGDKHAASKMRKGLRVLDANAELVLRMLSAPNMLEAHKIALGLDCDKTPQQDDANGVKSTCTSSSGPGEIASVATTTTSSQSEMAPCLQKDPLEDSRGLGVLVLDE